MQSHPRESNPRPTDYETVRQPWHEPFGDVTKADGLLRNSSSGSERHVPRQWAVYDGAIVGLLASQRGRRIALVRLAIENGPRQDDFRAPWFVKRPGVEEWAEIAQFPKALQQACFPRDL
jgi:hypothetical protein